MRVNWPRRAARSFPWWICESMGSGGGAHAILGFDRRRDVPEVPAVSAPKPSQSASRWACGDALGMDRIALWARRNPTTFEATRFAGGGGHEIRLPPHRR